MKQNSTQHYEKMPMRHTDSDVDQDGNSNRVNPRVTQEMQNFIIPLIRSGNTNRQINKKLRANKILLPKVPDLSSVEMQEIRVLKDCWMDEALLTPEQYQVGFNHIGELILKWAELGDAAHARLVGDTSAGADILGKNFEKLTVRECSAIFASATKFLFAMFGGGLPEHLKAEREGPKGPEFDEPKEAPVFEDITQYILQAATSSLQRALRELDIEKAEQQAALLQAEAEA